MMRTAEGVSPVAAPAVASSLALFAVVYFVVFGAGVYYLLQLMHRPTGNGDAETSPRTPERAAGITPGPSLEAPR
jgi:cytochrome d ubiquinol oxidase subunit I